MSNPIDRLQYIYHLARIRILQDVKAYSLGLVWWYLDTIFNTIVLYFITVVIFAQQSPNAAVGLLSGLLMFRFLQQAITSASMSLNIPMQLSTRLYVPKYPFVVRDVFVEVVKLLFGIVLVVLLGFFQQGISFSLFETVVVTIVAAAFALGVAPLVAISAALVPDVRMIIGYAFRVLFFVSGLFFTLEQVPEKWRTLFLLNPLALLVHEFRLATVSSQPIDYSWLAALFAVSLALGAFGYWLLMRYDKVLPKYVIPA